MFDPLVDPEELNEVGCPEGVEGLEKAVKGTTTGKELKNDGGLLKLDVVVCVFV